ncbi:hypothetical protein D1007_46503 [Hordeum vulgare]|nr:hypothetical protein D1007_46503 [Hordeum vulgare]
MLAANAATRKEALGLPLRLTATTHGADAAPPGQRLHKSSSMMPSSTKRVAIFLRRRPGASIQCSLCVSAPPADESPSRSFRRGKRSHLFLMACWVGAPLLSHGAGIARWIKEAMSRILQGQHRGFPG